jgi:hypothetical protein
MTPRTISRRCLIATAISGSAAWLGGHTVRGGPTYSVSELIALCWDLCCPRTIGIACLLALPAPERTRPFLARAVLADVRPTGGNHPQPDMLARAISELSRTDFRDGRVVSVDGWVLSLTETRVYALAALLAEPRVHAA